jgi:hypothetical protein
MQTFEKIFERIPKGVECAGEAVIYFSGKAKIPADIETGRDFA